MSEHMSGVSEHIPRVSGSTYITWYCLIEKKNYLTYPKIYQNLAWHNLSCLLDIQKVLKWNPNSPVTLTRNLNGYFSTLWIFFGDASIYKERSVRDNLCKTLSIFLPQHPHMKLWYHGKFYDFQTLFTFYKILKWYGHTIIFLGQDVQNFFLFDRYD